VTPKQQNRTGTANVDFIDLGLNINTRTNKAQNHFTTSANLFTRLFLPSPSTPQVEGPSRHKMFANINNLEVVHHAFNALLTSLGPVQTSRFTQQLPSPRPE
jgi:hypothetical protein